MVPKEGQLFLPAPDHLVGKIRTEPGFDVQDLKERKLSASQREAITWWSASNLILLSGLKDEVVGVAGQDEAPLVLETARVLVVSGGKSVPKELMDLHQTDPDGARKILASAAKLLIPLVKLTESGFRVDKILKPEA